MNRLLLISLLLLSSCEKQKSAEERVSESLEKDEVTLVKESDDAMLAAIKKARLTVNEFIEVIRKNDPEVKSISIKAPLKDGDQVEHIWLIDLTIEGDNFTGAIGNEVQEVKNYKTGQSVTVAKNEITDWMYIKDSVVYGNVTLKAMFKSMDPEEVKVLKKMMGWTE